MPSLTESPIGPPRMDRGERLRHRFYEPLLLLWILNRGRYPADMQPSVAEHSRRFPMTWRTFLDALSFVCDYERGGGSVNSVAAESTPHGTKFWLTARKGKAMAHLQSTLHHLESLRDKDEEAVSEIAKCITTDSVKFSKDKVAAYASSLIYYFDRAKQGSNGSSATVSSNLLMALDGLTSVVSHHVELTERATNFDDVELSELIQETSKFDQPSAWVPVRHVIRRLGSWARKSRVLVGFARHHPDLFEGHSCEFLATPKPLKLPKADAKTNLGSALKRMLPAQEQARAKELCAALGNLRGFDIEDGFAAAYSDPSVSLPVHAELFLMEHFHANKLRFVAGDKYIGCSKPSCYCCSLYMRYHPGNFVVRRSHGNVWPKWSPPLSSRLDSPGMYRLNLDIMNKVIAHLRRDLLEEIENRIAPRQRPPDSTSDFPIWDIEEQHATGQSDSGGCPC